MTHPFQKVINELKESEIKITGSENSYKLLFKLCLLKNIQMNGSPSTCAKNGNTNKNKVIKQSKDILDDYQEFNYLSIPHYFKQKGKEVIYKHDGNDTANRNLWNDSNKSKKDNSNKPIIYNLNTLK